MTIIIKKNSTKKEIEKLLAEFSLPKKKVGFREFLGKNFIDTGGLDAVEYQKILRSKGYL